MTTRLDPKRLAALEKKYDGIIADAGDESKWTMAKLARYVNDPIGFQREVLLFEPWSRQLEMADSVLKNSQTAVRGCNGAGKDREAAALLLWWVYTRDGALGLVTGPTQRQVDEIVFGREIAGLWRRAGLPGILLSHALRLPNVEVKDDGSISYGILGFVSTDQSKLTGHHAPWVMTVITEAQGVKDQAVDAMFNNATGENDRMLMVANPTEPQGRFFRACQDNSGWNAIRMPAKEHPNIVAGKTVIPGGPTVQWLDRVRKEWGEDSRDWKVFVEADFPDTATDAIVTRQWLEAAFNRQMTRSTLGIEPVVGLDVAREGGDLCCAAPIKGPQILPLVRWSPDPQNPTLGTVLRAEQVMRDIGGRPEITAESSVSRRDTNQQVIDSGPAWGKFVVDVALMGGGIVDRLRERGWQVLEWNGAKAPINAQEPDRFANDRAWGYWNLRLAFQRGEPVMMRDEGFAEAMLATRYGTNLKERTAIIRKPEIRATLGRSPDEADAVMMGWTHANVMTGEGGSVLTL